MNGLIKIRDVTAKYVISARTLRYYEDVGLIESTRSDDYAYRLYDAAAVRRLEQVLVLRKLNISIKDIQRILATAGSEVVLEVLGKKVAAINEEVSLLTELKEIVLAFIRQIEQAGFAKEEDVKQLYEKAKRIETQITSADYEGNTANVNRLLAVTEKLEKRPDIIERHSYCYLIFNLGSVSNVLEACEMYGHAFGAEKLSEDTSANDWIDGGWLGVDIKLFNFTIFIQSAGNPLGGNCCIKFTAEKELRKAYNILKNEAIACSLNTDWHWTPLSAVIKDKFGVNWLLCV